MRAIGLALGVFAGIVGGLACILDLEPRISCGDGHVDPEAGEECDPAVPSSFDCDGSPFPLGEGACDPTTCEILHDEEHCGVCGDGHVYREREECDGDNLDGKLCPISGVAAVQCTSDCKFDLTACPPCGNGALDVNEECDVNVDPDTVVNPIPCETLRSPYGDLRPYTYGTTIDCEANCQYKRLECSYCGDDRLDVEPVLVAEPDAKTLPEWCDGSRFDPNRLAEEYPNWCAGAGLQPNVGCADGCLAFVERFDIEPCCRKSGAACPLEGDTPRCCHEYDHPEEPACEIYNDGTGIKQACR